MSQIERIVGKPVDEILVPWTSAQGVVVRQREGWQLQVLVVTSDGTRHERSLVTETCIEAADAASVVLATSLTAAQSDPTLVAPPSNDPLPPAAVASTLSSAGAPAPSPQPTAISAAAPPAVGAPAPVAPDIVEPPPQAAAGHRNAVQVLLGARLGVDAALLGEPTAIVGMVSGVEYQRAAVRAFASATSSVEHEAPETEGGGARLALYAGGLQGCLSLAGVTLRLEGCGSGEVGVLRASGYGDVPGAHTESLVWSAGQASAILRWLRGAGSLWLEAELVVPFRPLHIEVADNELHETPALSARLWLGFALDL